MNKTSIEWCDHTLNPIVGCSKCSPGCDNCFAERIAAMRAKHPNPKISGKYAGVVDEHGKWTGKLNYDLSVMNNLPKKPKRIFVGSMTDLFHENMNYDHILSMVRAMIAHPEHVFILLTKRARRMAEFFTELKPSRVPQNVILMVTVENQKAADERIPALLSIPGDWKRGVSVEPMLAAIDLDKNEFLTPWRCQIEIPTLDWVVCGGETGHNARPMHPRWAEGLRDQCADAGVPFFFKHWGEWCPRSRHVLEGQGGLSASGIDPDCKKWDCVRLTEKGNNGWRLEHVGEGEDIYMQRVGKRLSGRLLDGKMWNEVPL